MNKHLSFFVAIALLITLPSCRVDSTAAMPSTPQAEKSSDNFYPSLEQIDRSLDRNDATSAVLKIEQRWKQQFENYLQGKFTTQVLSAPQISDALRQMNQRTGRKSALIYALSETGHLDLIVVSADGKPIHHRINAANRTALFQTLQAFRMGVIRNDSEPDDYLKPGQQLYQWMIAPLEAQLKREGITQLIFCLGAGLRSTPMAALYDGQQFLIEKYGVAIIPAFNLLDRQARTDPNTEILAMGASTFDQQSPLPGVPIELSAITQPPWAGTALLNQEFTLKNLRAAREKTPYGIVHLATHAEFAAGDVNQSYIQFWDQRLRLNQLEELGLRKPPVELLVLSACRTALGDRGAEMGFAGLAVQSGSKAAIASLWSVSDTSTVLLMQEFYRHLKTAPVKADALREAQIEMIRNSAEIRNRAQRSGNTLPATQNLSHPQNWAGFTLIGNPW